MTSFHRLDAEIVVNQLNSDQVNGLKSTDITPLRELYGRNKLVTEQKVNITIHIDVFLFNCICCSRISYYGI